MFALQASMSDFAISERTLLKYNIKHGKILTTLLFLYLELSNAIHLTTICIYMSECARGKYLRSNLPGANIKNHK